MNKKGQVTIYIAFLALAIIIIVIAGVLAPMGVLFNTEMFKAGESIMSRANSSISEIQDDDVREALLESIDSGFDAAENNIEVNNSIFKYSWVLLLFVAAISLFLFSRRMIEVGGGGFI